MISMLLFTSIALVVIYIAALWQIFNKAGQPGWGALIPIYNIYLMIKVAGRPGWWLVLFFIPIASLVVHIIINLDIARNFGRSNWFGVGMIFLGIIFYPILGFGSDRYQPVEH